MELLGQQQIGPRPWIGLGIGWSGEDGNFISVEFDQHGCVAKTFVPTKLTIIEIDVQPSKAPA
jgi:hypothetical protein